MCFDICFFSLIGVPIGITNSAIGLKTCAIVAGSKKYKSIIKLNSKILLNSKEVLISKTLIDSVISHDEFVLKSAVLKEYNKMKAEIKNLKTKSNLVYL